MNKFNGKTREDLIKLVVLQQSTIDMQGKKITDLESYIDGLVSSVIEVAPVLLHKEVKTSNRQDKSYIYHLLINYYIDIFLDPFSRTRDPNLDRRKFLFPLYVILKKKVVLTNCLLIEYLQRDVDVSIELIRTSPGQQSNFSRSFDSFLRALLT